MSKNKTLSPKQKHVRKIIKWVLLIVGIIIAYAALRGIMRDNFPLQIKDPVKFSQSENYFFSAIPYNGYTLMKTFTEPLKNGDLIYVAGQYGNYESDEIDGNLSLYVITPTTLEIQTEKQFKLQLQDEVEKVFVLNNGHFSILFLTGTGKVLREYDTDLNLVNERTFDLMSGFNTTIEFYHDGHYYAGKGDNLIKYDENFNVIENYSKDDFPDCDRISFIQDYEGKAYICASYVTDKNDDNYADKYIIRSTDGGSDINVNLGNDVTADSFGIKRGNADYPFLIMSDKYNDFASKILGADLHGNILYGIDKNGEAKKLIVTEAMPFSGYLDMDSYYNGVPHGDYHYFADYEYWSPDKTLNLFLCETEMIY